MTGVDNSEVWIIFLGLGEHWESGRWKADKGVDATWEREQLEGVQSLAGQYKACKFPRNESRYIKIFAQKDALIHRRWCRRKPQVNRMPVLDSKHNSYDLLI